MLEHFLGVRKFRYGLAEQQDQIGQVTGLGVDSGGRRIADHRSRCSAG
jgi:ATP-dependent Lon protease